MSVIGSNILAGASGASGGAAGAAEFKIDRSLRFNSADSAYLNRTPSSAGDRRKWTWSGWVKKSGGSGFEPFFSAGTTTWLDIAFNSDKLRCIFNAGVGAIGAISDAVFRDPSSWYHIVVAVDTTESTAADRIKFYVNGSSISHVAAGSGYPSQNYDTLVNSATIHRFGADGNNTIRYGSSYLADVHFIDGQALAPTDFGEYDSDNNWNPKEFTGSYKGPYYQGSPFSEMTSTSGNYSQYQSQDATNLFDGDTGDGWQFSGTTASAIFTPTTPISYSSQVRVYIGATGNIANTRWKVNGGSYQSFSSSGAQWLTVLSGSGTFSSFELYQNGDSYTMSMNAIEIDGTILVDGQGANSFRLSFEDNSRNKTLGYDQKETVTLNPDGGMGVVTYTGNGSTQNISGLGFQPDFVWFKQRSGGSFSGARSHELVDSVRGLGKALESSSSNTEFTSNNGLTAYNSDGFTIGSEGRVNENNASHVAWAWKAGGAASLNENGSIDSQVSVSTDYGFSIVSYTGNGTNGATIGHGLGATPAWVIVKNRDASKSWNVYHQSYNSSTDTALVLDGTGVTAGDKWRRDLFSSTVFGVRNVAQLNNNNEKYIAYCWSEVSGFSKFGSYTGNGSTTGPVITTGFKVRFLLIKRTDSTANWRIIDTERGAKELYPNLTNAEGTFDPVTYTDDGFQIKVTDSNYNASGGTYVYAAFADRPGNNFDVNNLVAASGNTISASSVSLTAPSGGFLSGRDSKTYVIDGDTSSYLLANNSGDNYSVNFSPGITVNSSVEIYGLTSGQSASTNLSSATSYTADQYSTIYSGSGTLTQITMVASGNRPGLAAIKVDGVLLIGTNDESVIDSLIDTPTNYDDGTNVGGNYCTWNPLEKTGSFTLANGNLATSNTSSFASAKGTMGFATGKWYYEATVTAAGAQLYGISTVKDPLPASGSQGYIGKNSYQWAYQSSSGNLFNNDAVTSFAALASGDVAMIAFDVDAGKVWFGRNGTWYNSGNPATGSNASYSNLSGAITPAITEYFNGNSNTNFGQRPFAHTPPSGFKSLCTTNLDDSLIADGSTVFDVPIWTGDGTARNITIDGGFSPDFVWVKNRSNTNGKHLLYDAIRGAGQNKALSSSETTAEGSVGDDSSNGYVASFLSDGFRVNSQRNTNIASDNYVAWCWDAGANSNKTYNVTVVSDSGNKYRFDDFGTSAVTLDLEEGSTYVFDQSDSSNSGHPLRFSTTSDGTHGGGSEYTTGVTTTGTPGSAGASTTIVVASGAPTLYYYCSVHSGMGGQADTNSTAGASNFDGSIQSTVRANASAGFSIVSYAGNSTNNSTIGHGLNAAPELIITKNRSAAYNWITYSAELAATKVLALDVTNAAFTPSGGYYSNVGASTYQVVQGSANLTNLNNSGDDYIAYCFTPVAGYSAFGSYTGTGTSDDSAPFVFLGFRPAMVILKTSSASGNDWYLFDNKRAAEYNPIEKPLYPNGSYPEQGDIRTVDFLSNGFKVRYNLHFNVNNTTIIYAAWAEHPFKTARAR